MRKNKGSFSRQAGENTSSQYAGNLSIFHNFVLQRYKYFVNEEEKNIRLLTSECRQFPYSFGFCLVQQVGVNLGGAYVRVAHQLLDLGLNFDQCKSPKEEEEVLRPEELLRQYHAQRTALDAKIDQTLAEIQQMLGIEIK